MKVRSRANFEFVVWAFLVGASSDAIVYMNSSADGFTASGGGRSWVNVFFLLIYLSGISLWAFKTNLRLSRQMLAASALPLLALLLCLTSAAWSVDPSTTFKQSILLLLATGFQVALYDRLGFVGAINAVRIAIYATVLLGYAAILFLPDLSISHDNHEGSWKGVFAHKNMLGAVSALGLLLSVGYALAGGARLRALAVPVPLLFLTLVMSGSITASIVATISVAGMFAWAWASRSRNPLVRKLLLLVALVASAALVANIDLAAIAAHFGRDSSATGRVPLWLAVISQIMERPWLGHGYAAFWTGIEGTQSTIARTIGFSVSHSHNGYLELALAFGIPLALLGVLVVAYRATRALLHRRSNSMDGSLVFGCLVFVLLFNVSETAVLAPHGLVWMIFVLTWIRLRRPQGEGSRA